MKLLESKMTFPFPALLDTARRMTCSGGSGWKNLTEAEFLAATRKFSLGQMTDAEATCAGLTEDEREYLACPYEDHGGFVESVFFMAACCCPAGDILSTIYNGEG